MNGDKYGDDGDDKSFAATTNTSLSVALRDPEEKPSSSDALRECNASESELPPYTSLLKLRV
jgi:hypothetical protein